MMMPALWVWPRGRWPGNAAARGSGWGAGRDGAGERDRRGRSASGARERAGRGVAVAGRGSCGAGDRDGGRGRRVLHAHLLEVQEGPLGDRKLFLVALNALLGGDDGHVGLGRRRHVRDEGFGRRRDAFGLLLRRLELGGEGVEVRVVVLAHRLQQRRLERLQDHEASGAFDAKVAEV
ncbi:hypothetical protein M885DRAFT_539587 [Pelagophyceae sp. CCMP2097]|nr:hypothetical protein M885DRAFT_539587 [Pelagophyceae sp. CCMP2097]